MKYEEFVKETGPRPRCSETRSRKAMEHVRSQLLDKYDLLFDGGSQGRIFS